MPLRWDNDGLLKPARKTEEGFLVCDAFLTRAGIFSYRRADGSTRRELRPPEEVSAATSLSTLQNKPLTLGHPPLTRSPRVVSPDTIREDSVGQISNTVEFVQGRVLARDVTVLREDAIKAVESGTQQISAGYRTDTEEAPGIHPQWGRYDAIQRNIRYNHGAIVTAGRAGSDIRLRLDEGDAVMVDDEQATSEPVGSQPVRKTKKMAQIILDGNIVELDDQAKVAVEAAVERRDSKITELETANTDLTKERDTEKGRADGLEAEKKDRADAQGEPEDFLEKFNARKDVLVVVSQLKLDEGDNALKVDTLTDAELRLAVLKSRRPDEDFSERSDDYLQARFDAVQVQLAEVGNKLPGELPPGDGDRVDHDDPMAAAKAAYSNHLSGIAEATA